VPKVDYIIVGQGLAGTLLAYELLEANQKVLIVDKPHPAMASKVAAGLFNPVGVKRCIRSWNADVFLPFAINRYRLLEEKLGVSFLNIKPIYRLFSNRENRQQWQVKCSNENMDDYIGGFEPANSYSYLKDEFGGASISPAGNLRVNILLEASREFFQAQQMLLSEEFDFDQLDVEEGTYKGIATKKIIFCEGFRAIKNPFFNWLPFAPTKGEVITIRIPEVEQMDKIISKGIFIMSLGNHLYLVGATFNRDDWDDVVTEQGIASLQEKLEEILAIDYEIVDSKAGVRPTVRDRKPFLGTHPKHPKLAIFNGLGTRGVIQGPRLSADFSDFLTQGKKISQNTDIQRYNNLFDA
jgi:glycine oxidase